MGFQQNTEQTKPVKTPDMVYATARNNLLLVVAFTAVNVLLRLVKADMYFLFSASMPMACLDIAALVEDATFTMIASVFALFITALYLLCWIFSKKHRGWMVAALVLFALDTLLLFAVYEFTSMIFDVLIHGWVLYYLITGTVAMAKMKRQPDVIPSYETATEQPMYDGAVIPPVSQVPTEFAATDAPVMENEQPLDEHPEA